MTYLVRPDRPSEQVGQWPIAVQHETGIACRQAVQDDLRLTHRVAAANTGGTVDQSMYILYKMLFMSQ